MSHSPHVDWAVQLRRRTKWARKSRTKSRLNTTFALPSPIVNIETLHWNTIHKSDALQNLKCPLFPNLYGTAFVFTTLWIQKFVLKAVSMDQLDKFNLICAENWKRREEERSFKTVAAAHVYSDVISFDSVWQLTEMQQWLQFADER